MTGSNEEYKSNHQGIGGIQTGNLDDVIEEGKDLISHMNLSQRDIEVVPELTMLASDISIDLERLDTDGAVEKLDWYFTRCRAPIAQAQTEEEIIDVLNSSVPDGAYAINNTDKYVEMQLGLRAIYDKLKAAQKKAKPVLRTTMRKR
jgi:hypothetical protein